MNIRTRSTWWRRVVRLAARQLFRWAENNDDPRLECNGEQWCLRTLLGAHVTSIPTRPFVALDAGANAGDYTQAVLDAVRTAGGTVVVHTFEPSPLSVTRLRERFKAEPSVKIVATALSDRTGEATLHDGRQGSSQASLVQRPGLPSDLADTISVPLLRLDEYLKKQEVTHVDLLKLDVEGSELAALRGLGASLRPDVVDVIQFEYGGAALDAGTTLREVYRLLESRGYVLAKLFPRAFEVRPYRDWMEHYAYANYVALSPRWIVSTPGGSK